MSLYEYLTTYLGEYATTVGLPTGTIAFAVDEAVTLYGVATEAEATDLLKLHTIGKMTVWSGVNIFMSAKFDYSADGESFSLSQLKEFASQQLSTSTSAASTYLPSLQQTSMATLPINGNPYRRDWRNPYAYPTVDGNF